MSILGNIYNYSLMARLTNNNFVFEDVPMERFFFQKDIS